MKPQMKGYRAEKSEKSMFRSYIDTFPSVSRVSRIKDNKEGKLGMKISFREGVYVDDVIDILPNIKGFMGVNIDSASFSSGKYKNVPLGWDLYRQGGEQNVRAAADYDNLPIPFVAEKIEEAKDKLRDGKLKGVNPELSDKIDVMGENHIEMKGDNLVYADMLGFVGLVNTISKNLNRNRWFGDSSMKANILVQNEDYTAKYDNQKAFDFY
ncbi:MAG: hypothetical protein ACQEP1_01605 [Nanobdellota archaeon]